MQEKRILALKKIQRLGRKYLAKRVNLEKERMKEYLKAQELINAYRDIELGKIITEYNFKKSKPENPKKKISNRNHSCSPHYISPKYYKTEVSAINHSFLTKNSSYENKCQKRVNKTIETCPSENFANKSQLKKSRKLTYEIYNNKETKTILNYYQKNKRKGTEISVDRKF